MSWNDLVTMLGANWKTPDTEIIMPTKKKTVEYSEVYTKSCEMIDKLHEFGNVTKIHEMVDKPIETTRKLPAINTKLNLKVLIPSVSKTIPITRVCPSRYDAIQIHGFFGLINTGVGSYGENVLIVHTGSRLSKDHMLSLKNGDEIHIINLHEHKNRVLHVRYVSRYKYVSPGTPITTLQIGVDGWV